MDKLAKVVDIIVPYRIIIKEHSDQYGFIQKQENK